MTTINTLLLRRLVPHLTRRSLASRRALWTTNIKSSNSNNNRTIAATTAAAASVWPIRKPAPGTGFDNFLNDDDDKKKNDDDDSSTRRSRASQGGDNNNNNNNDNNNWRLLGWSALLAVLAYMEYRRDAPRASETTQPSPDGSSSSNSIFAAAATHREVSWHEFLQLLQQGDVLKVVVTDQNKTARIYLHPKAVGLRSSSSSSWQQQQQSPESSSNAMMPHTDDVFVTDDRTDWGNATAQQQQPSSQSQPLPNIPDSPFYYRMQIGSIEAFERKLEDSQRALGQPPHRDVPVQYTTDNTVGQALMSTVPGLAVAAMVYAMMRFTTRGAGGAAGGGMGPGGGLFQIGKSTAQKIDKHQIPVTFADVAGCEQAKKEIMEFVDFLKDAEPFERLGAKIPKGALLCGPPGTGKTLLAKAVAGEAGVPFFSISGSDFIEMFVGVGPSRVRDLFRDARQAAPCIVFIDEIDAVGRQRGRGGAMGGNDERENTLNQLLVEMDGFEASTGVVVLAGTNRVDILDQALTRPGRFDRQITVDKPDLAGRKAIFQVHLKGLTLEDSTDEIAGRLAGLTPGFAGADIANICNEAAIVAARRQAETVALADFETATDRIIGGLESNKIMSAEERQIVAHHEAGHAVAGWFLEHADPLLKVTIIPRTSGALGFAQYLPKEVFLRTQPQIMDIVCMALAGRAAEELFFGRVTTGASDDLRRVTDLIYQTIQLYGMNERLGQLAFPKDPNGSVLDERPYSEKTATAMDEEARAMVEAAYDRTLALLRDKRQQVEQVAHLLLEQETITHDDMLDLIGERPFAGDPAYQEFVSKRKPAEPGEDLTATPGLA